jgi:hypothetical protein
MRGRRRTAAAVAVVLGLLVLAGSTAVVVALARHRPPPAVTVGTRPLPPAGQPNPPVTDTSPVPVGSAAPSTRPAPTVRVDESTGAITVRTGTLIDVQLRGDPTDRWSEPDTPTPQLLQRLSGSATPDGNAAATFRAVTAGDAIITVERSSTCSSGPTGGVCGVEARRISVTVTA